MTKPDFSFFAFANDFEEMLGNYFNLQNSMVIKNTKIEYNLFKSMGFVYVFSILEKYTNNKFWELKSDKDFKKLPTTFSTWTRYKEFENAYRIRNCFMHRLGFLNTNKDSDRDIIQFKTDNPNESEYYKIDNENGKDFILIDLKWRNKMKRLPTDYIDWVKPKGHWLLD